MHSAHFVPLASIFLMVVVMIC